MRSFCRTFGVILVLVGTFIALAGIATWSFVALAGLPVIVLGFALCELANVQDRLAYLEEKLDIHMPESDGELPQKKCLDCGQEFDFDYPACPNCGGTDAEPVEQQDGALSETPDETPSEMPDEVPDDEIADEIPDEIPDEEIEDY